MSEKTGKDTKKGQPAEDVDDIETPFGLFVGSLMLSTGGWMGAWICYGARRNGNPNYLLYRRNT